MNLIFYIGIFCLAFAISLFIWFGGQSGKNLFGDQGGNWGKRIGASLALAALGTVFAYVNTEYIWK